MRPAVVVAVVFTLAPFSSAHAAPARRPYPFDLFAPATNVLLRANRVRCNINNVGEQCVDSRNSPVVGGGFWPRGTGDQYVFNGGPQIAGIIAGTAQPNFPWPGDTVGAFFFDERGDQSMGEALTGVYDGLRGEDRLRWPDAARAGDPSLFDPFLLGRAQASEQDTWTRYWDAGPQRPGWGTFNYGRKHPAGLLVDQRTLAWNGPGLEDMVFFVFHVINVSARSAATYQRLAAAGYDAGAIAEVAGIGSRFHDLMAERFQVQIPDSGYTIAQAYFSYTQDPDVGSAGSNFSNANLVLNSVFAYQSPFLQAAWQYPPEVFGPPFAAVPGFEALSLLRTPPDTGGTFPGITTTSNTSGGAPNPAPVGVSRLWRMLSLNLLPTDGTCSVPNPKVRRFCYFAQVPADTRIYEASGPFTLSPGEAAVFVVAQVYAPALDSAVRPYIGASVRPGLPIEGTRLVQGLDTVRTIDRIAGWVSSSDANGNGRIDPGEVVTVPRSLYWKVQLAQAVLAHGFQQPQAPDAPDVSVLPGDNQATVVWQPSASERAGDPYFAVAADPTSPLYDPDYRRYDVEGYRVWRGRSPSTMRVVAQYDYAGTQMADYTGQLLSTWTGSGCAPELGVTTTCPSFPYEVGLAGDVVQVRLGDRVLLGNGAVGVLRADTAVTGGASGRQALRDTGVPFVYVDHQVGNGETWLYAVTAFDVNSVRSGFSTMESPLAVHAVTPRAPAGNVRPAVIALDMLGDDGVPLDPTLPFPAIDAANGTFQGPIPPANAGVLALLDPISELLAAGDYEVRIDSASPGFINGYWPNPRLYLTFTSPDTVYQRIFDLLPPTFNSSAYYSVEPLATEERLLRYDTAAATRFGISRAVTDAGRLRVGFVDTITSIAAQSATVALSQGRYGVADQASRYLAHSRWFDEGASEPPDPTIDFAPSASHNSGSLTGVTSIWAPAVYRNPTGAGGPTQMSINIRGYVYGRPLWYPADITVTWGANGTVTVRDDTHHVDLPAKAGIEPGYGFLDVSALLAAGVTSAMIADGTGTPDVTVPSYHVLFALDPVCRPDWWGIACALLSPTAELEPLDFNNDGVSDGTGIILLVNGEAFFMWMNALPAPGTQWHLRAAGGTGMHATCTPPLPINGLTQLLAAPADCFDYDFTPVRPTRPALAPGLRYRLRVANAYTVVSADSADLSRVHTVPDPYYLGTRLETDGYQRLTFVNLPDRAVIRIYSLSGILVQILTHHDASGGGEEAWDLRSRTGRRVASGVYLYHIEAADGRTRVGRMTIVNGQ